MFSGYNVKLEFGLTPIKSHPHHELQKNRPTSSWTQEMRQVLVWDHDRVEDTTDVVVTSLFEAVDKDLQEQDRKLRSKQKGKRSRSESNEKKEKKEKKNGKKKKKKVSSSSSSSSEVNSSASSSDSSTQVRLLMIMFYTRPRCKT